MTGKPPDENPRRHGKQLVGPAMVGISVITAGLAGVAVQLGEYVPGVIVIVVGGAIATGAELTSRRSSGQTRVAGAYPSGRTSIAPDMLPDDPHHFVGRSAELERLSTESATADASDTIVISALEGMGGIGKTSMAVHWAHSAGNRFPDGRIYLDLRGFGPGEPISTAEAMVAIVEAFGLRRRAGQPDLAALQHIYLGLLWQKKVLVILDNARDEEQVGPLIPDAPGCVVVITSRNRLSGLSNVRTIPLDLLSDADAKTLIREHIGAAADRNPGAVEDIIRICGNLPLALTIASATAARIPGVPLGRVVDQLRESRQRVMTDNRRPQGATPKLVFHWSYEQLSQTAATAFRLLSCHPAQPFSLRAAASIMNTSERTAFVLLTELDNKYLITQRLSNEYIFHDLVREYSGVLRKSHDTGQSVAAAARRMVDYYTYSAHSAASTINPLRRPIRLATSASGVSPEFFHTFPEAADWLDRHYLLLLAMIHVAARADLTDQAWQLAWSVGDSIDRNLHWVTLGAAMQTAYESAVRGQSQLGKAVTLRWLGRAQLKIGEYESARVHFTNALDLATASRDWEQQALCFHNLALLEEQLENYGEALTLARSALEMYEKTGDPSGEGRGANAVGWTLTLLGRHAEAVQICEQALRALEQIGDRQGQADTLDSLGRAHHHLGDLDSAEKSYRRAVALYAEIGNLPAEASTLRFLGEVCLIRGCPDRAAEVWSHAMQIMSDLDLPGSEILACRLANIRTGTTWRRIFERLTRALHR